jgi:hypothetical protein
MSRKIPIIRDKGIKAIMHGDVTKKIRQRIYGHGRGWVFNSKDFQDITSLETTRQILGRLTREGKIIRLREGIYHFPNTSSLLNIPTNPDPDAVARAIARANGWTVMPTGDTALNLLGLSHQVPVQYQYFSDGPTKKYEWSGGKLSFKHRTNKETTILSPRTALLVQALKTLGEDSLDEAILNRFIKEYTERELKIAVKEAKYSTSWVHNIIKQLVVKKKALYA